MRLSGVRNGQTVAWIRRSDSMQPKLPMRDFPRWFYLDYLICPHHRLGYIRIGNG